MEGAKTKILIVEDEKAIAFDLKFMVESLDFEVAGIAANYEDAVRQAIATEPDIALVDIHLKGSKSGIDAAKTFRDNFDIPVIFLTSSTDSNILNKAIETEPFAYLVKPVRKNDLLTNIGLARANNEKTRALKFQLENISSAIHTIETPLIITGPDKKITYINKSAENIIMFNQDELIGKQVTDYFIIPGNNVEPLFKDHGDTSFNFAEGTKFKIKNKSLIDFGGSVNSFSDQDGNLSGYLISLHINIKDKTKGITFSDEKDSTFLSDEYFFIKDKGQMYRVNLEDINYIEALGDYIIVHTDNKRFTTLMTMKKLEIALPSDKFARVHRSFIISIDKIKSINSNDMDVYIKEKRIPIGDTYKQELIRKIKIL